MADVKIVVKPKYVTRKATDKVIFRNEDFLTVVDTVVPRQIVALLDTSFVALDVDGKFYPIDIDNYKEQYDLVAAGEDPTVEEDENFGYLQIEAFASPSESNICEKIQKDIQVYNGLVYGTLIKVTKYESLGDSKIDKNGYWLVFNFDLTGATTAGYSELKINKTEVADGDNYVFMGADEFEVSRAILSIYGKFTVSEDLAVYMSNTFKLTLKTVNPFAADESPSIEVNGKKFDTLVDAFAAAKDSQTITVSKSVTETVNTAASIDDGRFITLLLKNNAVINLKKGIEVHNGGLTILGEGVIRESTPSRAPVILDNTNESNHAMVYVDEGITLQGKIGLFFTKASYNLSAVSHGHLIGGNEGFGFYANGSVKSGSLTLTGDVESTEGVGVYLAGNINSSIKNCNITGTESGLEIRAGNLVIDNCRITSTSEEEPDMKPNGNGTTSIACAVAVAQHTTKHPINVEILSGTFIGKAAFMEGNPQETAEATDNTSIKIYNGTFAGQIKTLKPAEDCTKFISGGIYSVKPDKAYIADEYKAKPRGNSTFEVLPMNNDDRFLESLHITKLDDRLYEATYPPCDYMADNEFFKKNGMNRAKGACSSIQAGNIRARHFDWYYTNAATIVIKTEAADGVYENYAVTGGFADLTDEVIDSEVYDELYRHLSSTVLDGFNEKGLVISDNVVPTGDIDTPDNYVKNNSFCNRNVLRYVLDKAANVPEAIDLLEQMNIWCDEYHGSKVVLHWHISDAEGNSVIVEIIDGKIKYVDGNVMTNYYNTIPMTPHSNGIERYNILSDGLSGVTDVASALELMKKVRYTRTYDTTVDPYWYSELNSNTKEFGDLTIDSKPEDYAALIEYMVDRYEHRSRETGDTWQTEHCSVYDTANNTLTLQIQEEDKEYTFSL